MWTRSSCRLSRNLSEDVLLSPGPRPVSRLNRTNPPPLGKRVSMQQNILPPDYYDPSSLSPHILWTQAIPHLPSKVYWNIHGLVTWPKKKRPLYALRQPRSLFVNILFSAGGTCTAYRYVKKSAVKQQISPFGSFPQYQ